MSMKRSTIILIVLAAIVLAAIEVTLGKWVTANQINEAVMSAQLSNVQLRDHQAQRILDLEDAILQGTDEASAYMIVDLNNRLMSCETGEEGP